MWELVQAVGLCLCAAVLAALLKKSNPEISLLLALSAVLIVLGSVLLRASELLADMRILLGQANLPQEVFLPVLRTLGIALTARIGGELCRDAGQNALAAAVDICGGLCALVAVLPLLRALTALLMEWI